MTSKEGGAERESKRERDRERESVCVCFEMWRRGDWEVNQGEAIALSAFRDNSLRLWSFGKKEKKKKKKRELNFTFSTDKHHA